MPQCPDCIGTGAVAFFVNGGTDIREHWSGVKACAFCNGSGHVDQGKIDDRESRRAEGHAWYERERREDERLSDVARRLGVSTSEVSAMRLGQAPLPGYDKEG